MKRITLLFCCLSISISIFAQLTTPPSGNNQKNVVTQYIGALAHVTITYNSPNVTSPTGQDRTGQIWGQLVPYGLTDQGFGTSKAAPWRAGANENTTFEFSHDVMIQGKSLKAGKYGFHIIVEENKPWTLIFSNNSTAWGSFFYDPAEDALRVEATPEKSEFHQWLTYEFTERQPESCTVALIWENIKLPFKIEVPKMNELYVQTMRQELQNSPGFNYQTWVTAVNYCVQNNTNLEEALTWADYAISGPFIGQENFTTLQAKAAALQALNRIPEAQKIMDKAIKDPTATAFAIHGYGRQLMATGDKKKAVEVFEYNYQRFNGAWPTNVGLARGYSAIGQYDKALKHAQAGLAEAPDAVNKNFLTQAVEKLKNKQDIN
ncbi:MAG: DUF2911 domain-containing protein [Saprospiraceae bacterium]|nr:DUF2911 domain-containing protein [Saprospiraceae bacterium]